jgi:colanic acid biosynthesis glycosyl transferase WcaI
MRILIYSANFAPEPTGIGKYSGEMSAWLAARGHNVRVVAAPPYYPAWKVNPDYLRPRYRREKWHGVDVWRAPLWVPKVPTGRSRVFHLASFAVTSLPIMLRQIFWRPSVVLVVAPAFMCAPCALLAARLCGAEAWLHLQDFEVDVAFGLGLLKGKLLQRLVLRMERWVLRRFDVVSSISSRMVERLLIKGVQQERTRYFPNWVDISHVRPSQTSESYRAQLGIAANAVVVLFSGSLGAKQGLMVIPEVARLLAQRRDIQFVVCGDGVMKPPLEAAAAGMANIHFLPLQPFHRLGELLATADVHFLPQSPDAADLVLPSKLSGMLASGRPVIATCRQGTELHSVVSMCGLVVPPEDSSTLAEAIRKLSDEPEARLEFGRRARAYAEANFERDAVLGRVFGSLESEASEVANDAVA